MKGVSNNDSSSKLTDLYNLLLMRIVENPKNDLSHSKINTITRKVCTYYVRYYSVSFLCSIHAMYNIFNCDQNQHLLLKL